MLRRKIDIPTKKIVWRMTAADPVAVDIDLSQLPFEAKGPLELPDRGWLESSRDLLDGLRVREMPMDTLPSDLIEAFAKKAADKPPVQRIDGSLFDADGSKERSGAGVPSAAAPGLRLARTQLPHP